MLDCWSRWPIQQGITQRTRCKLVKQYLPFMIESILCQPGFRAQDLLLSGELCYQYTTVALQINLSIPSFYSYSIHIFPNIDPHIFYQIDITKYFPTLNFLTGSHSSPLLKAASSPSHGLNSFFHTFI